MTFLSSIFKRGVIKMVELTGAIAMVGGQVFVARRDLMLDESHDVCEGEGPATGSAGEGVGWHARGGGPAALCRAVRIRWWKRGVVMVNNVIDNIKIIEKN